MKIVVNPVAALLAVAEKRALLHFTPDAMDLVHARKRAQAEAVLAGFDPSADFAQAATIEGMTVNELANLIVSKPDNLMEKENARRTVVVKLRQAKNGAELEQVLKDAGVSLNNLVSDLR